MIGASLHPAAVQAVCRPRGRFAFGLTPRAIGLLVVGLLLALPGFFDARLAYGMTPTLAESAILVESTGRFPGRGWRAARGASGASTAAAGRSLGVSVSAD